MIVIDVEKTCLKCGKKYCVPNSQSQRSKYCSDACFRRAKDTREKYSCDYCGKEFLVQQHKLLELKDGKRLGLYCSAQCAKDVQKPKWSDIVCEFESRGYELVSTSYTNAKEKLLYVCKKHREMGIQSILLNNLRHGNGCKYCGREKIRDKRRSAFEHVRKIFASHDMILLDQPYINSQTPLQYICKHHPEHGVQYMTSSNAHVQYCPICQISKGEKRIYDYLIAHDIEFERQKKFDDLGEHKRNKLSYDFYLPKYNTLIEYQGQQHERPIDIFGGEATFVIQQEHDRLKREYANAHGITLIEIWYYDYRNVNKILDKELQNILLQCA